MEVTKLWQLLSRNSCSWSSLHAHFNRDNWEQWFRLCTVTVGLR